MKLEENENSMETESSLVEKTPQLGSNKYVILKNHVKELGISKEECPNIVENTFETVLSRKQARKLKRVKQKLSGNSDNRKNTLSKTEKNEIYNTQTVNNIPSSVEQVTPSDLEELRTVYKKCKDVLVKIETKYGHLLELDPDDYICKRKKPKIEGSDQECKCTGNKKIIFDDEGKQLETESNKSIHICLNKLKSNHSDASNNNKNVTVEYGEHRPLPHDLVLLSAILRDESIEVTFRNEVISKMKAIKQAHLNELKFERPKLIEKLKSDPEDVFEFKGSNISKLPGYPK